MQTTKEQIKAGHPAPPVIDPEPASTSTCPKCKKEVEDNDGFGVLAHTNPPFPDGCGYCRHPNRTDGVCGICGDKEQKLDPPRYKPGHYVTVTPQICTKEKLPAFKDEKEITLYRSQIGCSAVGMIRQPWLCKVCGHWHYVGKGVSPSGNTSDQIRDSSYPRDPFIPFRRKNPVKRLAKTTEEAIKEARSMGSLF